MIKRLFIAVPIHLPACEKLVNKWMYDPHLNQNQLNWIPPSNWHLTLHFLGNTAVSELPLIEDLIEKACSDVSAFNTQVVGVGLFPGSQNPKIVWMGFDSLSPLEPVREQMASFLPTLCPQWEYKPFNPHLTIARVKKITHLKRLVKLEQKYNGVVFATLNVDRLVLFESILTKTGATYKALFEKRLKDQ